MKKKSINILPLLLSTSITIGGFKLLLNSTPIYKDKIIKNKKYDFEYIQSDEIELTSEYIDFKITDSNYNKISIYTPWEIIYGEYRRTKRTYEIDDINNELIEHIINNDIEFIIKNAKFVKSEVQSSLKEELNNKYLISAKLSYIDKNDKILVSESNIKNICCTLLEFVTILGLYIPINKVYNKETIKRKRDRHE